MVKTLDTQAVITEINQTIEQLVPLVAINKGGPTVDRTILLANRNIALISSAIERFTPPNSPYRKALAKILAEKSLSKYGEILDIYPAVLGVLEALKLSYEQGFLLCVEQIINAETFSDFMEMAKELLDSNYYISAAVLIAGVLEETLRKLSTKNELAITRQDKEKEIPLKAEAMNTNLMTEEVYGKLTNKQVTGWLDLRNKAAHGLYEDFNKGHVEQLYTGVLQFLNDYPI